MKITVSRLLIVLICFLPFATAVAQAPAHKTRVVINSLTLHNAHKLSAADQRHIVDEVKPYSYDTDNLEEVAAEITEWIRFALQKRGYPKAEISNPKIQVKRATSDHELVDVSVELQEGEQYLLKEIGFSSTTVFSPAELRTVFPIRDGDIFDREEIGFGLQNLRGRYCTRGYVNFTAVPEAAFDDTERKVSLKIDLDEGGVFHVGKLVARGVESQPGAREKLLKVWKSYEGKVYDCGVLDRFLHDLHARAGVKPQDIFEVSPDSQEHVVNVYVTLMKPIF